MPLPVLFVLRPDIHITDLAVIVRKGPDAGVYVVQIQKQRIQLILIHHPGEAKSLALPRRQLGDVVAAVSDIAVLIVLSAGQLVDLSCTY